MSKKKEEGLTGGAALEGILSGLTGLMDKLNELAKTGKELHEISDSAGSGKDKALRAVYGLKVKVGLGEEEPSVEPFGNLRGDKEHGFTVTPEVSEPIVDIFEETDHILVIAEMPGIGLEDVDVEVADDILTLDASKDAKKYHKEILLPRAYERDHLRLSCNNGILEIKCLNE
ncbi:MAG: Hsp20/alpha crystallin family protein [Methylococcus sp.]|nr:Hsp20/alpha crystallin family protein [Methylococcus sp.]